MARIRTIKPEFFRHEALYDAERSSGLPLRLAFAGLWTACDREGRFRWSPRTLKLDCLPHDDVDFSRVLDALATRGFIVRYASQGGEYGYVPGFSRHQIVNNREAPSSLPDPQNCTELTRAPRVDDACPTPLVQDQGEGKGREQEGERKGKDSATQTALPSVGTPLDFKKELWSRGVPFLKTCGLDEAHARTMLGKWRRDHGDLEVLNALASAEGAAVSEPIAYIQKTLNSKGKSNGSDGQHGRVARATRVLGAINARARAEREGAGG